MKELENVAMLEAKSGQASLPLSDTVERNAVLAICYLEELKSVQGSISMSHGLITGTIENEKALTALACLDRRFAISFIQK